MNLSYQPTDTHIIYAGGTFGSHGTPLSPLPANTFLPILQKFLDKQSPITCHILSNNLIKDSSTLTPSDFVHFYELILTAYKQGAKYFVLITGTDTLSFLAAFLFHALAGLPQLSLVITGSMQPLLLAHEPNYQPNPQSDAWHNLSGAITATTNHCGVFVYFYQQLFWANNTQKIYSQRINSFIGTPADNDCILPTWHELDPDTTKQRATFADIHSLYLLPNNPQQIALQLQQLSLNAKAVILISFGAGNLHQTDDIKDALNHLYQKNIAVVCTTMCAFGGVSSDYVAGAWQYQHHVWSGGVLGVAGIYGKLLWLYLSNRLNKDNWEQI